METAVAGRAADVFGGAKTPSETLDLKTLHAKIGQLTLENDFIDSPAFTGRVLSEFKLRLSRVFLPLANDVPPDNFFGNPNRGHKVPC